MKHQLAPDDTIHRHEHLHFSRPSDIRGSSEISTVNVRQHTRHHKSKCRTVKETDTIKEVNHASSIIQIPEDEASITSDHHEFETPLFNPLTNEGGSIESINEIPLFPTITYEEQTNSPIFRTTSPEAEMPMISVHYELPDDNTTQLNSMETAV